MGQRMSRSKTAEVDETAPRTTLQIHVAIKQVLKLEQTHRYTTDERFVSMSRIVAEALADHFKGRPEYVKILKEAGLIE